MARINWKKLVKQIPGKVQITPKVSYDVVWQKEIVDTQGKFLYGLTDISNKVITIRMDMSAKDTMNTFFHELTHAVDEEFKIGLTENQTLDMENFLPVLIKLNILKL